MTASNLRHWLSRGELDKLENVVLEGKGLRLLGEQSPDLRTRVFLKGLPNYLTKISQIHDAVFRGSLAEVQRLVESEPKKKLAIAKDPAGTPLIHKAVYYDHQDVLEWIVDNYPTTVEQKDREGRTALHYCAACRDPETVWDILIEAGCDASVCDKRGNPAAYYLQRGFEIELPDPDRMTGKRLRNRDSSKWNNSLDFKPSNIRIWIHNRDIGKLQHVLWEGHGSKLRCEISNNVRVKRFLEAVPSIMSTIKDIHSATIKNDIEGFRKKVEEPVSPIILISKDSNGLNVLHKAAGLAYVELAREILDRYPAIVNTQDNEGRTPLHYAAVCKDGGVMYDLLVEYGADENKVDHRQKTGAFYKNRPSDIDLTNLVIIPDAPRVSGNYPRHWDWRIIDSDLPLSRMKRTSNTDEDSAFGSAESAKLTEDLATPEIENGEDELNGIEEENNEAKEEEKPEVDEEENADEANGEEEEEKEPEENPEEEAAEDKNEENEDEGHEEETPIADKETGEAETAPEKEEDEENDAEEEKDNEEEEAEDKADPSTADSGVANTPNDEEQEIIGEQAEPPDKDNEEDESEPQPNEEEEEEEEEEKEEEEEEEKEEANKEENGEEEGEETGGEENTNGMAVDEEADELVQNGNMEQLAALVLTGEGHRLIGRHSSNSDLQNFIDNVPAYMAKIRAVHKAAREGNLKDLQIYLDRRKFAIAKDALSPHGATPLHVAVIFGHTSVIRYLAGRFPETAHALDLDGRTPLHYAATLADNGHYYNLLLHLGANPLVQDNFGQKADYYKENQEDLSHKQLLRDFGASESLADEMLVDKDQKIFQDEEGRYLASSLGDPLIRGLTEVATTRPKDPVTYLATYLYNFANQEKSNEEKEDSNIFIISEGEQNERSENQDNGNQDNDNENDDGYPQSPDLDSPESLFADTDRDENGQSSLHFAANRSHSKDGLYHLLQEKQINIALRDARYRTGRDIAELSGNEENVKEIDRFVVYLAARGETDKLVELLMDGYDHILDTEDEGKNILQITQEEDNKSTVEFLKSIENYTELRDIVHRAIRSGDSLKVREIMEMNGDGARILALGKNTMGRCSLHIAVLCEHEDIVRYIAKSQPETLGIGDNLERTALHYAMGVPSVESMSSILIKAGAKRVQKDLRSRQPTYYFMNKTDIKQLQDEEESMEK